MAVLTETGSATIEPILSRSISNLPASSLLGSAFMEPIASRSISNLPAPNPVGTATIETITQLYIPGRIGTYGIGQYHVSGTVKDGSNAGLARRVIAVDRDSGVVYDSVQSDASTGAFTLKVPSNTVYVMCLPLASDNVNAEVYDRITPIL